MESRIGGTFFGDVPELYWEDFFWKKLFNLSQIDVI